MIFVILSKIFRYFRKCCDMIVFGEFGIPNSSFDNTFC